MIPGPTLKRFGGALGEEFSRLWRAVQALQPQSIPGFLTQQTTRGVARVEIPNPVGKIIVELYPKTLGHDAILCTTVSDGTGNEIWVALPPLMRRGWMLVDPVSGHALLEEFTSPSSLGPVGWERWALYDSTPGRRTVKYSQDGTGPNQAGNHQVEESIWPKYKLQNALAPIYALKVPGTIINVDTTGKDPTEWGDGTATISVSYIDLNVDAREWRKLYRTTDVSAPELTSATRDGAGVF